MTNIWGFSFPRKTTTRPSDLNGITNGQVPDHLLRDVGIRSSKLHHLFNRGFQCLRWYCEQAGWTLDLASIDPRTYARQVAIFAGDRSPEGRYLPESMWAAHEAAGGRWATRDGGGYDIRLWEGKRWKRKAGTASAAIPGTSPHGDGLSSDIAIRRPDGSYPPIAVTEEFARWLVDSGIVLACGMHWSLDSEPWHVQHTNGDDTTDFVKQWEQRIADPNDPATPPPSDVDPPINQPDPNQFYKARRDNMDILDYGFAGVDGWWTRMYVSGGSLGWVQGLANEWAEPDDPRADGNQGGVHRIEEKASGHTQVANDDHMFSLLATYTATTECPVTFIGNTRLLNAWGWSFSRGFGYRGDFNSWVAAYGIK